MYIYICQHAYIHTCIHTYTHAYIHTSKNNKTNTNNHKRPQLERASMWRRKLVNNCRFGTAISTPICYKYHFESKKEVAMQKCRDEVLHLQCEMERSNFHSIAYATQNGRSEFRNAANIMFKTCNMKCLSLKCCRRHAK